MPPDDSKLARLLPGIAARSAETQESVRKNAKQEEAAATLPSAYEAEQGGNVGKWSVVCLLFSALFGSMAFALSCLPQRVSVTAPGAARPMETYAGCPLRFWQDLPNDVLLYPDGDAVLPSMFLLDGLFWLAAMLSVWGAGHWLIVRWFSRGWKFSLADLLAITAAAAFMLGAWRMDSAFRKHESARRFLQTVSENAEHKAVYHGPLVIPISEVSTPSLLFFCLAGASVGINLFHIVDRYALQMRQLT
jgi:hypothetical protein